MLGRNEETEPLREVHVFLYQHQNSMKPSAVLSFCGLISWSKIKKLVFF